MYYTYIARCADDSLYTGYTTDVAKREIQHNEGKGAAYTRMRRPVKIVYSEEFVNRSDAMKRECELKRFKKEDKEQLVKK